MSQESMSFRDMGHFATCKASSSIDGSARKGREEQIECLSPVHVIIPLTVGFVFITFCYISTTLSASSLTKSTEWETIRMIESFALDRISSFTFSALFASR